jgi:NhaA family Na+:H+ antiporter
MSEAGGALTPIQRFLKLEAAGGILLVIATVLAIIAENSPLRPLYDGFLDTPVEIRIGALQLAKPLLLWINDALMAVFFFLVGLELKREVVAGELSSPSKMALPLIAAAGGVIAPMLIYVALNQGDAVALKGWAIPTATDIAFALGVLSLLGDRVPANLKLFLLAIAIIDDIAAILIIALFYSGDLSLGMLAFAAAALAILWGLNRRCVSLAPYLLVGFVLWVAVLKSGVHATLAGILLAFFIPMKSCRDGEEPLLQRLEHDLHGTVAFVILPLFAFANAGIALDGLSLAQLLAPVPLGIALGLFLGKQAGVFLATFAAVRSGLAALPNGVTWFQLYALAVLCGIGFTMSLFISSLAFEQGGVNAFNDRLGIIMGSLASALAGYLLLRVATRRPG